MPQEKNAKTFSCWESGAAPLKLLATTANRSPPKTVTGPFLNPKNRRRAPKFSWISVMSLSRIMYESARSRNEVSAVVSQIMFA